MVQIPWSPAPRRCRDSVARRRTRSHAGGNGPGSAPQAEHAPGASAHCLNEAYVCASLSESARVARVCTVCTSPSRTMACTLCALAFRGGPERESTKNSSACDRSYINRPVGRLAERAAFSLRPPKLVDHDHNLACASLQRVERAKLERLCIVNMQPELV